MDRHHEDSKAFFIGRLQKPDDVHVPLQQFRIPEQREVELPDELRGRVSAVNSVFISSSNELGAFRAGSMAQWVGAVNAVVIGGFAILAIVAMQAKAFPELRRMKSMEGQAR